jgi:hypothetical protein
MSLFMTRQVTKRHSGFFYTVYSYNCFLLQQLALNVLSCVVVCGLNLHGHRWLLIYNYVTVVQDGPPIRMFISCQCISLSSGLLPSV